MRMAERILLVFARAGIFLMPFIPLIVAGSMFFPFITGKNFAFRIIVEVIFAAWLLLALRMPEFRPRKSLLLWGIAAFLAVVGIADIFGANPFKSFWSNFERMEGYVTLLHLAAYFLVASSVLNTEKLWLRFFATSVGVSAFLGIYGILQIAGKIVINQGGVRLDGTFGNAAYFAGYMLFHLFLTLFLFFRHRIAPTWKWLYGGALALQFFVLYFTATRGSAVALAVGLLLAAALVAFLERERKHLRWWAVGVAAAAVFAAVSLYAARNVPLVKANPVLSRFASISLEAGSARFMVWGMAFKGFKENPLLGWGQESFNFVFNKYYNPKMWAQEQWFDRTHNIILDWLIAGGLLGLLSYLALYGFFLYYLWRRGGDAGGFSVAEKSVLTGFLAAYFIQNFFVFDNIGSYLLFFSALAFLHSRAGVSEARLEKYPPVPDRAYQMSGAVVAAALVAALYFGNVRNILAAKDLIGALRSYPSGAEENLKYFRKTLDRGSFAEQEIVEQFTQAAVAVSNSSSAPDSVKAEFVSLASSSLGALIGRVPDDARLRVFMGSFLNRLGRSADALPHLEKAHELSLAKQTIAFELASSYLNLGRREDTFNLLEGAFRGAPENNTARLAFAVSAIYADRPQVVEELLVPVYGTVAVSDERIVKAYFDTKQYGKVLDIWKARVAREPANGQARISLAAAYLLVNNRAAAIASLEEAKRLAPQESHAQIDYFISEIRAGRNP